MKQATVQYMNAPNVAVLIKDDEKLLKKIGDKVCEDYKEDVDSMSEWKGMIEKGIKASKPAEAAKSWPWEGASNYKSPLMLESILQFGDRASVEILSHKDLVKASAENDDQEVLLRRTRIAKFMNWQFNYEMEEWREQQEHLFYGIAAIGCLFKKVYFDPSEGRNVSSVIYYPNFAVNNNTPSSAFMDRFSETKNYTENEIEANTRSGIWIDFQVDDDESEEAEDEEKDKALTDDFIEQWTRYDIDEDGYDEPYVITVHKATQKVVRIVARYDEDCIFVKAGEGVTEPYRRNFDARLKEAAQEKQQEIMAELQQSMMNGDEVEEVDPQEFIEELQQEVMASMEIIKIKPLRDVIKYQFIPDPSGKFLGIGYYHLLTAYSEVINTTTNQMIDAGTLANVPGGLVSKEFRNNKSPIRWSPGKFTSVDVPAQVMQSGMVLNQFKGADQTLMMLSEKVEKAARSLGATVNLQDAIAPNAPAATTLGILQEKLIPTTAIIKRVLRSMGQEFRVMGSLNYRYTDPFTYQEVVNEPADYKADFERYTYDIELTASNAMTSHVQKMQTASVLLEQLPIVMQTGGDARPVMQYLFEGVNANELFTKVYPDPNSMTPEQQAAIQQQQQMQEQILQQQQVANELNNQALQEKQQSNALKQAELQIKAAEQQRKQMETMADIEREALELQIKMQSSEIDGALAQAQINEIMAQAERHIAAANTDVLRAQAQALTQTVSNIQSEIGAFTNVR